MNSNVKLLLNFKPNFPDCFRKRSENLLRRKQFKRKKYDDPWRVLATSFECPEGFGLVGARSVFLFFAWSGGQSGIGFSASCSRFPNRFPEISQKAAQKLSPPPKKRIAALVVNLV